MKLGIIYGKTRIFESRGCCRSGCFGSVSVVTPTEAEASLGADSTIAGIEMSKIGVRTLPVEYFYTIYDIHDEIENFHGNKCFSFWTENHADCARCVMSCPFTKEENRLHQSVRIMAGNVPGMHNIAREMDDLFGYGDDPMKNIDASVADFWERRPEDICKDRR